MCVDCLIGTDNTLQILSEHPELPDHIREGIEGLMCHLLIREKREGKVCVGIS